MKKIVVILLIGLFSRISALSQGSINFDINFGAFPPPHTSGNPTSGATLTGDMLSVILYLDTTTPISGSIEGVANRTLTTVFQFTDLVDATYTGGGEGLDYEGSWQLTDGQIQNLLAGQWYANVTYSDTSFLGEITAVPEPSSVTLFLVGLVVFSASGYHRIARLMC